MADHSVPGRFRVVTVSGVLTAIAAKSSSAGHLLTLHNPVAAAKLTLIERVQLQFQVTALPVTTAQEIGFSVFRSSPHTVNAAVGGAAVTITTPQTKLRTGHAVPTTTIYYANAAGALTAGTYTLDTLPMDEVHGWCLAAGAAVPKPSIELDLDLRDNPLALAGDEGIVVTNAILMADSLAGRLTAKITMRELSA